MDADVEGRSPGRPRDPDRRAATLASATDYVLAHGLAGLSLRPLAAALGTSTRMLLYDFGSKEKLIGSILAEARRREAALFTEHLDTADTTREETLQAVWDWLTADEQVPYLRLFFEVYMDVVVHPDAYGEGARALVSDWVEFFGSTLRRHRFDPETATLVVAVIRGLLLDRLAAADPQRTDRALARFADLIGGEPSSGSE